MLQYTNLQIQSPIAMLGDGCDATTAAIQKVSSTKKQVRQHLHDHCILTTAVCNQLLVGWGSATPELYRAEYFISTADSVRQYINGFLSLSAALGLTYISVVTGLSHGADSYVSESFRQMASSAQQLYQVRSVLRLTPYCNSTCQLMPSGDDPSTLGASASRAVLLIASEAFTQEVVRAYDCLFHPSDDRNPCFDLLFLNGFSLTGQHTSPDRRAEGFPLGNSQWLSWHSDNTIELIWLDLSCTNH